MSPHTILPVASIADSKRLIFKSSEDQNVAWERGVFYLKAPAWLKLAPARCFGLEISAPESPYRDVPQYGELEGFISLDNNQQTKLALCRHRWNQHYPSEIAKFGRQLDDMGRAIIHEVLRRSGIPEQLWSAASGGYSSGGGTAFLNFVHYDTRHPDLGLRSHTDYGFVTILDATTPGLQVELGGQFMDVPVLDGHLVVNFGEALNFITEYSDQTVSAIVHRVTSQSASSPIRHGIVYFANPNLEGHVYQYDCEGRLRGSSTAHQLFSALENALTENDEVDQCVFMDWVLHDPLR